MAVTVMAMKAGQQRADHGPYVRAVCRSIEARGIRVTAARITPPARGVREAELTLRPEHGAFAETSPAEALAFWDERAGWSLSVRREAIDFRVSKGLDVLPDPGDVAAWVVVALIHPELTPSYEDGPSRELSVPDPGFEARLARYPAAP